MVVPLFAGLGKHIPEPALTVAANAVGNEAEIPFEGGILRKQFSNVPFTKQMIFEASTACM